MKATRLTGAIGTLALFALPVSSQVSRNVDLMGTLDPASRRSDYNDIWGYRDPETGKEYAILMSEDGTHIVDCTDPRNPVQRGMIPSENSFSSGNLWRDAKTWRRYAYVVSEAYGGLQIIDLGNPDNPKRVKLWGSGLWNNCHNVALDEGTGLLYAMGTNSGTHVIDVKTDPVNPQRIYRLSSPYIHDGSVRNGRAYLADQNGNKLRIYDVTQLPAAMPELGQVNLPGSSIAHATWSTRDGTLCVTANEASGGPVAIFDITNNRLPLQVATYRANAASAPSAIPHNVFVEDRILHVSHYTEGYRVLDLTDGANPVEVGYYDTYGGFSSGYAGAWGVYHEMPSGIIYVSDIESGLFVFKPKATPVRYGVSSAGSAGARPTIHTFGAAYLGNSRFRIDAEDAPANAPGAFFLGAGRTSAPVFGIELYVALSPAPLTVSVASDPGGAIAVPIPIPNLGTLDGTVLDAQFVFLDSATGPDFSSSQGLEFELFQL
jgi:choice-of-anchor B domain-containing protein